MPLAVDSQRVNHAAGGESQAGGVYSEDFQEEETGCSGEAPSRSCVTQQPRMYADTSVPSSQGVEDAIAAAVAAAYDEMKQLQDEKEEAAEEERKLRQEKAMQWEYEKEQEE